jgi:hypothetical protein
VIRLGNSIKTNKIQDMVVDRLIRRKLGSSRRTGDSRDTFGRTGKRHHHEGQMGTMEGL